MAGEYVYYRPNASQALARFDKERLVIAAARKVGVALGAEQMRVVFIIPTIPE
jgi:L-ribulose-5-phosphate 3-epimerase UlaE